MSNLHILHDNFAVSPWLDNVSRDLIVSGELRRYVEQGIRGVTSNPSIFEKAFKDGTLYKEPLATLKSAGKSTEEAYWELAIEDIQNACDILRPVFDESGGNDGFVSLEVSPALAHDSAKTTTQAKDLWNLVNRPNVMIKIPATEECIASIADTIAAGINVNVTLIFSLSRYLKVITAYMDGLERLADPSQVRSVASFFVSRVDSEVDTRLATKKDLLGIAAVAQARAAYGIFLESFNENAERWAKLVLAGAKPQRPLWASTSTKNPDYPDLLYVDGLLGRNSVNTLPDATVTAIIDHGAFEDKTSLLAQEIERAHEQLAELKVAGIDMRDVSAKLEQEGVQKFQDAFEAMLSSLDS
jgi:transaldolase